MTGIEFIDVKKSYTPGALKADTPLAVKGISFAVEQGTLTTILGPSGCGKTTTLRMIAGLEQPSAGSIKIKDKDVTGFSPAERNVSLVFQSYALFPHMKVLDNVMYGLNASNVPKEEAQRRAMASLENVGLTGYEGRWPAELSGGQQQRVAVARALVLEPAVLLFDEPLSNLDARLRRSMREEIRALQQRLQLTVVYVTHDQGEALAVSDKIIVMNEGRIAQMGTPRELYMKPADEFVAAFMGDALILDAQTTGPKQLSIGPLKVELAEPHGKEGAVRVAARPEAWRLVGAVQSEDFALANQLSAKVRTCAFLGAHFEYTLETELGELLVFDRDLSRRFEVGSVVGVGLDSHTLAVVDRR
jgi:iron(III) transport system ATP-binding protein